MVGIEDSLPGHSPVIVMNRPMQTHSWGGVGGWGVKPPAARFAYLA